MKDLALVQHKKTPQYVLMMVVSFAATVILTRYYLQWTGYPQIGSGDLHIAHLLWGGLAMFVGGLLPLIFANRGALDWSAVLSGVGVGLFIDEVGKFITKTNDYFYPPAAPIIYGVFLLTVLLYIEIRRRHNDSQRTQFYAVLDLLPVVVDQDITHQELARLTNDLKRIAAQDSNPALADLATHMLAFFNSEHLRIIQETPGWRQRLTAKLRVWEDRHFTRGRHRLLLVLGLVIPELVSLIELLLLLIIIMFPTQIADAWAQATFTNAELNSLKDPLWLVVRFLLDGVAGLLAVGGGILLLFKKEQRGVSLGVIALVLSLTINNLLVFYLDQFQALTFTLVQGGVLLLAVTYRNRYLTSRGEEFD